MIEKIRRYLEQKLGKHIEMSVIRSRKILIQKKQKSDAITIVLNKIFLDAPEETLSIISDFLTGKNKKIARRHLIEYAHKTMRETLKEKNFVVSGKFFNLKEIFDRLNQQYFNNLITSKITFGKRCKKERTSSIVFGNYSPQLNIIRINRSLDQDFVPEYFIEYIVFHEMLHAYMHLSSKGKKSTGHSKKFKEMEKIYPDLEKAEQWKRKNLNFFINANKGKKCLEN